MNYSPIEILYPINSQLPSPRANSIQVVNTCHALAEAGAVVHLLARLSRSGSPEEIMDYYGLKPSGRLRFHFLRTAWIGSISFFNLTFQASMTRRLFALRRRGARQCLYTRDMMCAATALRLRWLLDFPVVYEVHALNHWTNPLFTNTKGSPAHLERLKRRERYVYEGAKALVSISASCRDALKSTFPVQTTIEVIHDSTPLYIPPDSRQDAGSPRLLYVGQFYPWKGVETAVRAMAHLRECSLDLFGGDYFTARGDIDRLVKLAAEAGVSDRVSFKGFVPPGRIREVLGGNYIGILPAADNVMGRHFISPLKLFEYMGCSIPVVASDLPPLREILVNGQNGLLYEPDNPLDLARQVRRLAGDQDLRRAITRRAYDDAQEHSYERRAKKLLELIEGVVP